MADLPINENDAQPVAVVDRTDPTVQMAVNPDGSIGQRTFQNTQAKALHLYATSANINLPTSGTETRMLLLRNPAASGKIVRVTTLRAWITNTTATQAIVRVYIAPTITATGTTSATFSTYAGGGATTAVALAYTGPTATVTGSRVTGNTCTSGSSQTSIFDDIDGTIILAAGQDLLITGQPDGTNRATEVVLKWVEE